MARFEEIGGWALSSKYTRETGPARKPGREDGAQTSKEVPIEAAGQVGKPRVIQELDAVSPETMMNLGQEVIVQKPVSQEKSDKIIW